MLMMSAVYASRLQEHGFEFDLSAEMPVAPLDKKEILTDEQAMRWLEQQVKGLPKKGGR
jgi:hypothetical protein